MNVINQLITNELKKKSCIHRAYGIVTQVITVKGSDGQDKETGQFKVKITKDYNEIKHIKELIDSGGEVDIPNCLTLTNKSHDTLEVGDYVWIHYWNMVSDGYIAIKVGLSSFDSGIEFLPYYRESSATHAYVITTEGWCADE